MADLSLLDKLLDENNDEPITLLDDNDNKVDFARVAVIPYNCRLYAILKPLTELPGVGDNDAFVFVLEEDDDECCLVAVSDRSTCAKVFEAFRKLTEAN